MRPLLLLLLPALVTVRAVQGAPGELLTAPFGPNGTWNLYQASPSPLSWIKAQELAAATADPAGNSGKPGHLVTIASGAENMFVYSHVRGSSLWIGLTDCEKFPGATEAGAVQDRGWAWVTGEPVTFTNWQSAEPGDSSIPPRSSGEDAVSLETGAEWSDQPMGENGQAEKRLPFMIEWDVQSPQPVPGARVIGTILPARWPALDTLPDDPAKSSPWVCLQTPGLPGETLMEALVKHLEEHWTENLPFRMTSPDFRIARAASRNLLGWGFAPGIDFPGAGTNNTGVLARARLIIPRAGTWTFNVHADDGFALRLGTHPWKTVHGKGGIDPLDKTTLYSLVPITDTDTRGVIELPAGEVPVEIFYMNGIAEGGLQIMTAEGEFAHDGSTRQWRVPGYRAGGKIAWPGIAGDGWKVTVPPAGGDRKETADKGVLESLLRVASPGAAVTSGLELIHFHDPECARRTRFPGAVPYPGDPPGPQDDRVVLAEATLVIPRDGLYHVGVAGDDLAALQIADQKWERLVRDASGRMGRIEGDSISARRTAMFSSQELIGEIKLARGSYPIRVVSWDRNGTSNCAVFAAPAGFPPRLLAKDAAGEEDDVPGLEVLPFQP